MEDAKSEKYLQMQYFVFFTMEYTCRHPLKMCLTVCSTKTYRIYSSKRRGTYQIFCSSSVALNRGRRLFEAGANLKIGSYKEIFSFTI